MREVFLASVCLLLLSACTQGQCPTGNCASASSVDPIQTSEQVNASALGADVGSGTDVVVDIQNSEALSVDNANKQANMKDKSVENATNAANAEGERVGKISYDDAVINASVISTGCTLAEDFQVEHEIRDSICLVTLVRTKPDFCRRAPFIVEIAIEWVRPAQCQSLPLKLTNPIGDLAKATSKSSTARQLPKD